MDSLTDQQLLRQYVAHTSEAAFAELVRRHIDLIYSAALRMVGDAQLAEDVTQDVFVALAGSSKQLTGRAVLAGWLHQTARNLAANLIRSDSRRRIREQEAASMNELLSSNREESWEEIGPELDAAISELDESERDVLLLRYFERKNAAEIAKTLGVSQHAAHKRAQRAVERLRYSLTKRNVSAGVGALALVTSANAVRSAPSGLAASISASAWSMGSGQAQSLAAVVGKGAVLTALQKGALMMMVTTIAAVGILEVQKPWAFKERERAKSAGILASGTAFAQPDSSVAAGAATARAPDLANGQEKWRASVRDYSEDETPMVGNNRLTKSNLFRAQEELKSAMAKVDPGSALPPWLLVQRAHIEARTGKWEEATADLKQAVQLNPSNAWNSYLLSSALLQTGKLPEFQSHSHAMMVRFRDRADSVAAGRTSEAYLVAPYGDKDDLEMSVELVDKKVFPWWRQFYKGLAEYRLDHYSNAVAWLEQDIKQLDIATRVDRPLCEADCYLVVAMARRQLNHIPEARAALARGREVAQSKIPQPGSADLGTYWWNGVTTRVLLKEAEETVEGRSPAALTFSLPGTAVTPAAAGKGIFVVNGPFFEPPAAGLSIVPSSVSINGGLLHFIVAGVTPGASICIQASGDLASPRAWVSISTNRATGSEVTVNGLSTTNAQFQFFRILEAQ
jgi:RNA polymerase sigma factor (sigma-70 family)